MTLNKLVCLPVGNRFYYIQHSNHIKNLAHLNCRDYITRDLCCITQEIKNPTIDKLSYDVSRLGAINCCVASCTLKKVNTWTGVCRVDFGDSEREKGACDIEVDIIETLACVASVSVSLGFFVRSKHFSLFGRAKIGASAKEVGEGG